MKSTLTIFIITFLLLFAVRKIAIGINLVDKPNVRKQHSGNIPLVGGISIYFALWVVYLLHSEWLPQFTLYMVCTSILLIVGVLDDRFDLPVMPRIIVQASVAIAMMYAGFHLSNLGSIWPNIDFKLGYAGYVITVFAVWGAINAFNMVDGIDGLLGILSTITFAALAIIFYTGGKTELAQWSLSMLIACIPYILLNLGLPLGGRFKVFMGDAGSTLIGFTVIWLLLLASQSEDAVMRPVTALWLIAIPLMDMVTIMVRRISRGDSPFKPDREHLHHILMRSGFTSHQTLVAITGSAAFIALIGVVGERFSIPESVMLAWFLLMFAGYFWFIAKLDRSAVLEKQV